MNERMDSRHWSQRWLRVAQVGTDAVVLYDLSQSIEIRGCGRGRCADLTGHPVTAGPRFRVTRFWGMEVCPYCGRLFGYARADQTVYFGDSLEEALETYAAGEQSLFSGADEQVA